MLRVRVAVSFLVPPDREEPDRKTCDRSPTERGPPWGGGGAEIPLEVFLAQPLGSTVISFPPRLPPVLIMRKTFAISGRVTRGNSWGQVRYLPICSGPTSGSLGLCEGA